MHSFAHHRQWNAVQEVYQKLRASGHQALLAGGCVRDLIMGREPNDFDLASDATPDQVGALFPSALLVGREFGVTIIPYDGYQIEVATFRVDGDYKDGRRPETVTFSTPEDDAKRRDFTVNALFFELGENTIIDFVNGQEDIRLKVIRAVGDPEKRFTEDKLRLLRAVRFAAQLDFEIEPKTMTAIKTLAKEVAVVSSERIRDELTKLLKTKNAKRGFRLLIETKLMESVLPELSHKFLDPKVRAKTEERLLAGGIVAELAWLNLLAGPVEAMGDKGGETLKTLLKRLKFSNQESEAITWVLKNRSTFTSPDLAAHEPKLIRALAHPHAGIAELFFDRDVTPSIKETWRKIHTEILNNNKKLPDRLLNGDDLQELGLAKGRELGILLEEIFDLQLSGQITTMDDAKAWVRDRLTAKN